MFATLKTKQKHCKKHTKRKGGVWRERFQVYSVKQCSKAIAKGYLDDGCIWVWVLINYHFRCRNYVSLFGTAILLQWDSRKIRMDFQIYASSRCLNTSTAVGYAALGVRWDGHLTISHNTTSAENKTHAKNKQLLQKLRLFRLWYHHLVARMHMRQSNNQGLRTNTTWYIERSHISNILTCLQVLDSSVRNSWINQKPGSAFSDPFNLG